jgi:hypothetical protein
MAKQNHCSKCHIIVSGDHSEVECLQEQLRKMSEDRNAWKEAWYRQREATGKVAWQYLRPEGY